MEQLAKLKRGAGRFTFLQELGQVIVKLVDTYHERAALALSDIIRDETQRMQLAGQLDKNGSGRVQGNQAEKEPDASWTPVILPPGRTRQWPSLVVEVARTESSAHLTMTARWWLSNSNGDVKLVVLIDINQRRPVLTFEIWANRLQQFAYQTRSTPQPQPQNVQQQVQRILQQQQLQRQQVQQQILLLNQQSAQQEQLNQQLIQQIQQIMQQQQSPEQQLRQLHQLHQQRQQQQPQQQQQYDVAVQGAPLILPFRHVFLRNPATPIERDISISANDIREIACSTWRAIGYV